MRPGSNSDKDNIQFPKVQPRVSGFAYRLLFGLFLAGVIVLFAFCFTLLPRFISLRTIASCGNAALSSTCGSQSHPPSLSSPTVSVSSTATHVATPTHVPTPTSVPSKASTKAPIPTGIPIIPDWQVVMQMLQDYREDVLSGSQSSLYKAYDLLSQEVQNKESPSDFVKNPNYTLAQGCLVIGKVTLTQADSQTWNASIPVTRVSCVDQTPEVHYSWIFQIDLGDGPPEITAIGLYPTGSGN